jgi:hypothetical protein
MNEKVSFGEAVNPVDIKNLFNVWNIFLLFF